MMNTYLAVDFGGGSGRIMAGSICQGTLKLEEVYRFPNRQVRMGNHVYWDFLVRGEKRCVSKFGRSENI